MLTTVEAAEILREEFHAATDRYGWRVGRFVIMPDHLHFFCSCDETPGNVSLSRFIGGYKQWTSKRILKASGLDPPLWQKQFFDHLLRSDESYEAKWLYVRENPVRPGLVRSADQWPHGGEIATIMR